MALITFNTFLGWNVKKWVLLARPGEGSLTQHHTMCWSVIRMEGESCCQHKLWGHLLYGIKGSREGPAVSLGLMVCASSYLGPDPKCSLVLQCFPLQLCSNQSLGSVSHVTETMTLQSVSLQYGKYLKTQHVCYVGEEHSAPNSCWIRMTAPSTSISSMCMVFTFNPSSLLLDLNCSYLNKWKYHHLGLA